MLRNLVLVLILPVLAFGLPTSGHADGTDGDAAKQPRGDRVSFGSDSLVGEPFVLYYNTDFNIVGDHFEEGDFSQHETLLMSSYGNGVFEVLSVDDDQNIVSIRIDVGEHRTIERYDGETDEMLHGLDGNSFIVKRGDEDRWSIERDPVGTTPQEDLDGMEEWILEAFADAVADPLSHYRSEFADKSFAVGTSFDLDPLVIGLEGQIVGAIIEIESNPTLSAKLVGTTKRYGLNAAVFELTYQERVYNEEMNGPATSLLTGTLVLDLETMLELEFTLDGSFGMYMTEDDEQIIGHGAVSLSRSSAPAVYIMNGIEEYDSWEFGQSSLAVGDTIHSSTHRQSQTRYVIHNERLNETGSIRDEFDIELLEMDDDGNVSQVRINVYQHVTEATLNGQRDIETNPVSGRIYVATRQGDSWQYRYCPDSDRSPNNRVSADEHEALDLLLAIGVSSYLRDSLAGQTLVAGEEVEIDMQSYFAFIVEEEWDTEFVVTFARAFREEGRVYAELHANGVMRVAEDGSSLTMVAEGIIIVDTETLLATGQSYDGTLTLDMPGVTGRGTMDIQMQSSLR